MIDDLGMQFLMDILFMLDLAEVDWAREEMIKATSLRGPSDNP